MGRCTHGDATRISRDRRFRRRGVGRCGRSSQPDRDDAAGVDALRLRRDHVGQRHDAGDRRHRRGRLPRHPARAAKRSRSSAIARRRCATCWRSISLTFAVLSSGNLSIDPAREREELATHAAHAQFVRDAGGAVSADHRRAAEGPRRRRRRLPPPRTLMTELGKRTADLGIPLVYHHHMNSTGEKPQEVAAVLDAADPEARAAAVRRRALPAGRRRSGGGAAPYREWIEVVHLKDVRPAGQSPAARRARRRLPTSSSSSDAGASICRACSRRCARSLRQVGDRRARSRAGSGRHAEGSPAEINKRYLVECRRSACSTSKRSRNGRSQPSAPAPASARAAARRRARRRYAHAGDHEHHHVAAGDLQHVAGRPSRSACRRPRRPCRRGRRPSRPPAAETCPTRA